VHPTLIPSTPEPTRKTQARLYPEVDRPSLTSADVRALVDFGSDGEPLVPQQGRHWTWG
jgi:hypothetical protein